MSESTSRHVTQTRVFARVRPPDDIERPIACSLQGTHQGKEVLKFIEPELQPGETEPLDHMFSFDRIFGPSVSQDDVYAAIARPLVLDVLQGVNATLFAYGQTGSGKTYTLTGGADYLQRGMVPRAIQQVFHLKHSHPEYAIRVFVSYMEIYNEKAYDLLDTEHQGKPFEAWSRVQVRHTAGGELDLSGLQVFEAETHQDALNLLFLGNHNRMTAETSMNRASSRSHCVFTLAIQRLDADAVTVIRSKLHMCDLAGSERVDKTEVELNGEVLPDRRARSRSRARSASRAGRASSASSVASSGRDGGSVAGSVGSRRSASTAGTARSWDRRSIATASATPRSGSRMQLQGDTPVGWNRNSLRREGRYINLSLHYLQKVMLALLARQRYPGRHRHIPYRNSMLTNVLQDSLEGNCKTAFVATISPDPAFIAESVSTCRFIQRCGLLQVRVQRNQNVDFHALSDQLLMQRHALAIEVVRLRRLLLAGGAPRELVMKPALPAVEQALQQEADSLAELSASTALQGSPLESASATESRFPDDGSAGTSPPLVPPVTPASSTAPMALQPPAPQEQPAAAHSGSSGTSSGQAAHCSSRALSSSGQASQPIAQTMSSSSGAAQPSPARSSEPLTAKPAHSAVPRALYGRSDSLSSGVSVLPASQPSVMEPVPVASPEPASAAALAAAARAPASGSASSMSPLRQSIGQQSTGQQSTGQQSTGQESAGQRTAECSRGWSMPSLPSPTGSSGASELGGDALFWKYNASGKRHLRILELASNRKHLVWREPATRAMRGGLELRAVGGVEPGIAPGAGPLHAAIADACVSFITHDRPLVVQLPDTDADMADLVDARDACVAAFRQMVALAHAEAEVEAEAAANATASAGSA